MKKNSFSMLWLLLQTLLCSAQSSQTLIIQEGSITNLYDAFGKDTASPYMGYFSGYPNKSFVEGQFQEDEHSHYKYTNLPERSWRSSGGAGALQRTFGV